MIDGFKSWNAITDLEIDSFNYNGLQITRNSYGIFTLRGSLHKFYNEGLHNANDYYLSDFKKTLNQLFDDIGLNPDITPVNGFEFGVNIKLPTNPNETIKRLILHKCNAGLIDRIGKRFEYTNFTLKIYNKSEQCRIEPYQSENILRVEIKVDKMIYIRKKGVHCSVLSDLLEFNVWKRFEQILIEMIQECLFVDFTTKEISLLSTKNRIKYLEYVNPMFWECLHPNRNKYSRERAKCETFVSKHSKSNLKSNILNLITDKCTELRDISNADSIVKKWDKITVFKPITTPEKCDKITIKINGDFVPPENINLIHCKGCGKIIIKPRKGQMFCSAKEVGYNKAHKCRNNSSNLRNNKKRSIMRKNLIPSKWFF